ncbi:hypothetical protein Tco_1240662 [Tanacetum coccineum]
MKTIHDEEEHATFPNESPLQSVYSLGRDESSVSLNELTDLCTSLSKKVGALENELQQTKKTYKDEEDVEDSSKQDAEIKEKNSADTEIILEEEQPTELVEDIGSGEKGVSEVSIAAENLVYIRRSAEKKKDKGKGIMTEPEPEKKTKKQLEQERLGHEEAINKVGQERVVAKDDQAHVIDWSNPIVLRYHAQLNRPYSIAEVRKNMCIYLKNQGGFKMSHFKGMSYEEIKPIFERVWDQKTLARKRVGEKQSDQSAKRQKTEYEKEKEELKAYLDLVPREEFAMEI